MQLQTLTYLLIETSGNFGIKANLNRLQPTKYNNLSDINPFHLNSISVVVGFEWPFWIKSKIIRLSICQFGQFYTEVI